MVFMADCWSEEVYWSLIKEITYETLSESILVCNSQVPTGGG